MPDDAPSDGIWANPGFRAYLAQLALMGIVLAAALGATREEVLHWIGEALLLLGISLAAVGISQVRREWTGRPGLWGTIEKRGQIVRSRMAAFLWLCWNRTVGWLNKTWPWLAGALHLGIHRTHVGDRDTAIGAFGGSAVNVSSASGSLTLIGGSVERRLELLEQRMAETEKQFRDHEARHAQESQATRAAIDQEQAERVAEDQRIRERMADLAGGGLRLQAWGVACLLAGTVMTAIW